MSMGRRAVRLAILAAALSGGALLWASTAHAALIFVNTNADEYGAGAGCGLREAIEAANTNAAFGGCPAGSGDDQIDLRAPGSAYPRTRLGDDATNSAGDFDVGAGSLVILGHGGATIQGTDSSAGDRLFQKTGTGLLHLIRLTLRDGFTAGNGGAVLVDGGGVGITQSTITSNHAALHGGGMENSGGIGVFTNATVSGNTANGDGGGIDSDDAASSTLFDSSTVTENVADADAASTVGRGGGISLFRGSADLARTIVAGNADLTTASLAPDCFVDPGAGPLGSGGYNLIGDTTGCTFTAATGDIPDTNAMLAPLASNGGETQTHGLYPTSPAVDTGDPVVCNPVDQRDVMRPVGTRCDIGAFEGTVPAPPSGFVPAPSPTITPTTTPALSTRRKKCRRKKRAGPAVVAAKKKCRKKRGSR